MKVFISWSGQRSKHVATSLRWWLPKVIQSLVPWMSEEDIGKGQRWASEIAKELEASNAGIICCVQENLNRPWLLFESGALAKKFDTSKVCTYLFDLSPAQVEGPLAQFQHTLAAKDDTKKLVVQLNASTKAPLSEDGLNEAFDVWWPKLEAKLSETPKVEDGQVAKRSQSEMVEEILELVRGYGNLDEWVTEEIKQLRQDLEVKTKELYREIDAASRFH